MLRERYFRNNFISGAIQLYKEIGGKGYFNKRKEKDSKPFTGTLKSLRILVNKNK